MKLNLIELQRTAARVNNMAKASNSLGHYDIEAETVLALIARIIELELENKGYIQTLNRGSS